jgi:GNAT superfamily N-acetyltransferase
MRIEPVERDQDHPSSSGSTTPSRSAPASCRRSSGRWGNKPELLRAFTSSTRGPHGGGDAAQHRGGETFIVWDDDDTPAATITSNRLAKPELWTEEERAEPALYAHRVTVDRAYGGQGLGAELLDWAGTKAADEGTVVLPHNPCGAVFQRPAKHVPMPRLQEVESLTG